MENTNPSSVSKRVGNKIRHFRQEQGLTQEQLAEKAEVERSYIGKIERGERLKTLERLSSIAHSLGQPLWKLFK